MGDAALEHAQKIAQALRNGMPSVNVAIDVSSKKIGDQMKIAHKQSIPYVLTIGENEIASATYPLKNMETGEEQKVRVEEIVKIIRK